MIFLQGLVFKWGSLVGIRIPEGVANGTAFRGAADVAFKPRDFTVAIKYWTNVPYCTTDFGDYGDTDTDHLSRAHTPANIAKGIGDICRYMDWVDMSYWRMPTAAEWHELYGSAEADEGQSVKLGNGWTNGNYYPLSGRAMGAGQKYASLDGDGADARIINVDPWINGAIFLPASGNRDGTTGAINYIGSYGWFWSSTAINAGGGHRMNFDSSNVWPQYSAGGNSAFSVRCIRK